MSQIYAASRTEIIMFDAVHISACLSKENVEELEMCSITVTSCGLSIHKKNPPAKKNNNV